MISLLLEWRVKMAGSRLSSKGQVTIPQEVRVRLGLRTGDRVEFVEEGGKTILQPERAGAHSFSEFIGIAPYFKSIEEINAWVREMREDDRVSE
ncbi:MAG: AbrB/MazE/SpoVT family DNA-binding domain-containing protein [Acidobacteriaceae bacterium]|jgi:AbrB family looped-hinge helix DNA binding protein